jgi:hypothetical protein
MELFVSSFLWLHIILGFARSVSRHSEHDMQTALVGGTAWTLTTTSRIMQPCNSRSLSRPSRIASVTKCVNDADFDSKASQTAGRSMILSFSTSSRRVALRLVTLVWDLQSLPYNDLLVPVTARSSQIDSCPCSGPVRSPSRICVRFCQHVTLHNVGPFSAPGHGVPAQIVNWEGQYAQFTGTAWEGLVRAARDCEALVWVEGQQEERLLYRT